MKTRYLIFILPFLAFQSLRAQPVAEVQRTLVTKFTATPCGECGTWAWNLFGMLRDSLPEQAVMIAAHTGDSFLKNEISLEWEANLASSGQPRFYVGNDLQPATSATMGAAFEAMRDKAEAAWQTPPLANVGIETFWNGDQIDIKTRTLFFQNSNGAFYLGVYLVEDKVMAAQAGFSGWVAHHRLLRASATAAPFGNLLVAGLVSSGAEFSRTFTVSTSPWKLDNLNAVAVIWKKEGQYYVPVNAWSVAAKPMLSHTSEPSGGQGLEAFISPNIFSRGESGFITLRLDESAEVRIDLISVTGGFAGAVFEGRLPGGEHPISFDSALAPGGGWYALKIATGRRVAVLPVMIW